MGVFSVFKRFIISLYSFLMLFIVFINLLSFIGFDLWSGGPLSTINNTNTFDNSYFGFQSIFNAIDDLNEIKLVPEFMKVISALNGALSGGATNLGNAFSMVYNVIANGVGWDILGFLEYFFTGILEILIAPIEIFIALIACFACVVNFECYLIWWIAKVFGGFYNVPLNDVVTSSTSSISWIIPPNTSWQS